jgi:hypothetical protein
MSPVIRRAAAALGAVLLAAVVARGWQSVPTRREVHYLLGSHASSVVELDARWTDDATGEGVRDASFRYPAGRAPRVVVHEPELAEGRYTVAVTAITVADARRRTTQVTLPVRLDGSGAQPSLDLAPAIARAETGDVADPAAPAGAGERR